jgi:hypothetical protein
MLLLEKPQVKNKQQGLEINEQKMIEEFLNKDHLKTSRQDPLNQFHKVLNPHYHPRNQHIQNKMYQNYLNRHQYQYEVKLYHTVDHDP